MAGPAGHKRELTPEELETLRKRLELARAKRIENLKNKQAGQAGPQEEEPKGLTKIPKTPVADKDINPKLEEIHNTPTPKSDTHRAKHIQEEDIEEEQPTPKNKKSTKVKNIYNTTKPEKAKPYMKVVYYDKPTHKKMAMKFKGGQSSDSDYTSEEETPQQQPLQIPRFNMVGVFD